MGWGWKCTLLPSLIGLINKSLVPSFTFQIFKMGAWQFSIHLSSNSQHFQEHDYNKSQGHGGQGKLYREDKHFIGLFDHYSNVVDHCQCIVLGKISKILKLNFIFNSYHRLSIPIPYWIQRVFLPKAQYLYLKLEWLFSFSIRRLNSYFAI